MGEGGIFSKRFDTCHAVERRHISARISSKSVVVSYEGTMALEQRRFIERYALSGEIWQDARMPQQGSLYALRAAASTAADLPLSDFVLISGEERLDGPDAGEKWNAALAVTDVIEVSLVKLGDFYEDSDDEEAEVLLENLRDVGLFDGPETWPAVGRSWRCCLQLLQWIEDFDRYQPDWDSEDVRFEETLGKLDDLFRPCASRTLLHEPGFFLDAFQLGCWYLLEYAGPDLRDDRAILEPAVAVNWRALQYASARLKDDAALALAAVRQNASPKLRGDRDVVLAALSKNGVALRYAAPELRRDRDVVLAALSSSDVALRYASPELRRDRDVVLAALFKNGVALR